MRVGRMICATGGQYWGCFDTCYQKQAVARRMAQRFEGRIPITVMITRDMAKKPKPPASIPLAPRRPGRPPKPGGKLSQVEIQRAYRARLAAAGKVVRIVDAATVSPAPAHPALASMPEFDPITHFVCERAVYEQLRYDYNNALLQIERLTEDLKQIQLRNGYLERDLRLAGQHHTIALKDNIVLKQQLAEMTPKPAKRRRVI